MQRKRSTMAFFTNPSHFSRTGALLQSLCACWAIQKILKSGTSQSASPSRSLRYLDAPPACCCWIIHETEGCLVECLIPSTTAVSNVAVWGILLATAQDIFLSYCGIFLRPSSNVKLFMRLIKSFDMAQERFNV